MEYIDLLSVTCTLLLVTLVPIEVGFTNAVVGCWLSSIEVDGGSLPGSGTVSITGSVK